MKSLRHLCILAALIFCVNAYGQREKVNFDQDWSFAFGNAANPAEDFGCGTEYFNYLTKCNSVHNEGPYTLRFKEDSLRWRKVDLPFDFVVDLPFAKEASHSHGYKQVGWKYPETSVGWYRKAFTLPESDRGKNVRLQLDGVFRNSLVWVNGVLVGHEPSGYASQNYDITPYLHYGEPVIDEKGEMQNLNLVCVRADASLEEGWFYEGGGIYRHVWLIKTDPVHIATDGIFAHSALSPDYSNAVVTVETEVANDDSHDNYYSVTHQLIGPDGQIAGSAIVPPTSLLPHQTGKSVSTINVSSPTLWDTDNPNLYRLVTTVKNNGKATDRVETRIGLRQIDMDPDRGLLINGQPLKLKGVNNHQDHAGVGAGIPDGVQRYRMEQLKWMGGNALRTSHNPATPELLDICDELGILVFEENRLLGINPFEMRVAENMIKRDRNHPSVFLWGIGNEEWGMEWDPRSIDVGRTMSDYYHLLDPTRPTGVASSSGPHILIGVDVAGYNYVRQHQIDKLRAEYPDRLAIGSEETSGCGTRGIYFPGLESIGRMQALNRTAEGDTCLNRIERGWKFYDERPWLMGLFFWTGLDYRGESNPLVFPATGSSFGLLDYCGFPKDEAYYLKAWWCPEEPMVHLLPHWNLAGHEGEDIDIWAYGNCQEVELKVNGKSLGRKPMPKNGHLSWIAPYKPGRIEAIGYNGGKRVAYERINTTGAASAIDVKKSEYTDVVILDLTLRDDKGNFVADACDPIIVEVADAEILGWGNGDSAFQHIERPTDKAAKTMDIEAFNGHAQVIIKPHSPAYTYTLKFNQ